MSRITIGITAVAVIAALFLAYELNGFGGGKSEEASATGETGTARVPDESDTSRPGYTPGHDDKPGESK